jgi:hypothetical protein
MKIIKSIAAVLVGYLVFASLVLIFFQISGQRPHEPATLSIMLGSIAVGMASALLGGYLAALIAGRRPISHGIALAVLIATGAIVSLVSTLGHGSVWSQIAALALMVPCAVAGGWLRAKQLSGL